LLRRQLLKGRCIENHPNPAADLVPFGHRTLRDEAAQRRSPLRWARNCYAVNLSQRGDATGGRVCSTWGLDARRRGEVLTFSQGTGKDLTPRSPRASAWLAEQQTLRDEAAAAKRDAREEETLRIANEALSSANEANRIARDSETVARLQVRWAMWAAIIATVAAIIAMFKA